MAEKLPESRFKRVCVFCGSRSEKRDRFKEAARELGQELVAKSLDLVYGGGSIGLMCLLAQAVHDGGGHVLGIIPTPLAGKEKTGDPVGEVKMVANMHQRKAEMARHSDCFIALPGKETGMRKRYPGINFDNIVCINYCELRPSGATYPSIPSVKRNFPYFK